MTYDLAIIGGGPAGVAAGVYAARKKLKTVFITKDFESQSTVSLDIQNWIGTPHITGSDFASSLEKHLREYATDVVTIKTGELATEITEAKPRYFEIKTTKNSYSAHTILLTAGSRRRQLNVPGAQQFEHKGLTYCASCDGPLFADMDVVIVGGGNAGFDSAAQLLAYCKSVTLLARSDFKADPTTVEKTLAHPKFKGVKNTDIVEIHGDTFVTALTYKEKDSGTIIKLPTHGIFVEVGSIPNTDFVKDIVKIDETGHIVTNHKNQTTSMPGIWAAGDITDGLYHQNNIAAGDAVKALEDIYLYVHRTK